MTQLTSAPASYSTEIPPSIPAGASVLVCLAALEQCGQLIPPSSETKECVSFITSNFRYPVIYSFHISYLLSL